MKILELRFKNLNSLYGEWHIDFTESEYAYNGIFALTGPTGAGKSTILDAICLALYGSTPRLGRITQSSNDIMSRQTGECFAEVVFSSQSGRFRCHWAHHRSRKKANGELQIPRHEIAEATEGGKVLENKLTSVLSAVEDKTGMDFDRFTRSILLAQGGFDTFLKATVEQKSKILEQITGTKIYSDISIGVHERLREEKNKLENLESETRGIPILSPEEELAAEENLTLSLQKENLLENMVSDILNLKKKVDAGAEHLVSQLFFDNASFYSFLEKARIAGINVPIEAGIMPVVNKKQIERMVSMCGASLPLKFTKMIHKYENNPEAIRDAGIAYAIDQIVDLVSNGVDGIHLYTMNNPYIARKISEGVASIIRS